MTFIAELQRRNVIRAGRFQRQEFDMRAKSKIRSAIPVAYLRERLRAFRSGQRDNDIIPKEAHALDAADQQAAVRCFSKLT